MCCVGESAAAPSTSSKPRLPPRQVSVPASEKGLWPLELRAHPRPDHDAGSLRVRCGVTRQKLGQLPRSPSNGVDQKLAVSSPMISRQASRYRCALASSRSSSATRSARSHTSCCGRSDGRSARHTASAFQAAWRSSSTEATYKRPRPVLCPQPDALSRQVGWSGDGCTSIGRAVRGRLVGTTLPPAPSGSLTPDLSAASA